MTTLTRADVLEVCAVMLQRCRLTAGELAAHMGEPLRTAAVAPPAPARAPAMAHPGRLTPRLSEVLALCDRADGLSTQDLETELGIAKQTAFEYLQDLDRFTCVTRVKLPGRAGARYFARPANALAWADSQLQARAEAEAVVAAATAAAAAARSGRSGKAAARATLAAAKAARAAVRAAPRQALPARPAAVAKPVPAAKPAPKLPQGGTVVGPFVQAIARPAGETIVPAHVVIQRAPAKPDHRFTVAPDQVLTGGFSTSLPGINPMTGKGWGSAS